MPRLVREGDHVFYMPAECALVEHAGEADESRREALAVCFMWSRRDVEPAIGGIEQLREFARVALPQWLGCLLNQLCRLHDREARECQAGFGEPQVPHVDGFEAVGPATVINDGTLDTLVD